MYISITHNEPEIKTVGELLTRRDEQLIEKTFTISKFLDYKIDKKTDPLQLTNRDRIFERYILPEEKSRNEEAADANIEIKVGTTYYLPLDELDRETLFKVDENIVDTTSSKAFLAEKLAEILRDPGYVQTKILRDDQGALKQVDAGVQVYCWLRALDPNPISNAIPESIKKFTGPNGGWLNVSAFVETMDINVDANGGNFQISLSPIICKRDPIKGWTIDSVKGMNTGSTDDNYLAQSPISEHDRFLGFKRSQFFFNTVVQENDLFYIRYERLDSDKPLLFDSFTSDGIQIPGNTYDMIGLVDTSAIQSSASNTNVSVTIQGRDLVKVLIDDGSYFFPLQFANGIMQNAGDAEQADGKLVRRSKVTGDLTTLNAYIERSIQFSLQFIINQLSNTGLVPNSVFSSYGSANLSKRFRLTGNSISKITSISSSTSAFEPGGAQIDITRIDEVESSPTDGVWNIIKLVIDPSVRERRIVDSSIAQEQGSLINSVKKLCQDPFVEFYTDTYGDQFYFIVRKPPFDKKSALGLIYDSIETDGGQVDQLKNIFKKAEDTVLQITEGPSSSRISSLCLDIEEKDVITENLHYEQNAYSWYQITPQGLLMGLDSEMILAFIPVMSFNEYVEIWGSRPWQVTSNYIPYRAIVDSHTNERQNRVESQAFEDLKYMIESTQYLPFTRRGTIVVNGNRTYKRGLYIRHKPTNEIFYVDAVGQSTSISDKSSERITTLTVSRGMVEPFIKGKNILINGQLKKVSYFNIINTDLPKNATINDIKFLNSWKVDRDIFSFFLQRKQWE